MSGLSIGDWVGVYGAFLSTTIAIVATINYFSDGPKAVVTVYNPNEYFGDQSTFGIVVTNIGRQPIVVAKLLIEFLTSKSKSARLIGSDVIDQRLFTSPSFKLVRDPERANSKIVEPRVLQVGEEFLGNAGISQGFDADAKWIKVTAFVRNSSTQFIGWATPVAKNEVSDA